MMPPVMARIIFSLMDADGDGTVSLQEWQAAHERIFKAMDTDHDGTVTFEEMQAFMRGRAGKYLIAIRVALSRVRSPQKPRPVCSQGGWPGLPWRYMGRLSGRCQSVSGNPYPRG